MWKLKRFSCINMKAKWYSMSSQQRIKYEELVYNRLSRQHLLWMKVSRKVVSMEVTFEDRRTSETWFYDCMMLYNDIDHFFRKTFQGWPGTDSVHQKFNEIENEVFLMEALEKMRIFVYEFGRLKLKFLCEQFSLCIFCCNYHDLI